jgi:hypothetical protein
MVTHSVLWRWESVYILLCGRGDFSTRSVLYSLLCSMFWWCLILFLLLF